MTQHNARRVSPQMMADLDPIPVLDLAAMLRVVWQGKWIIMLTTVLCISLAGYYAFRMMQPRFAATAVLQIDVQPSTLQDVSGLPATAVADATSLNTQRAIMTSPHLLGKVVDILTLLDDPEFNRYLTPTAPLSITAIRSRLRNALAGTSDVMPSSAAIQDKTVENLRGAVAVTRRSNTYIFDIQAKSRSPEMAATIANALADVYLADKIAAQTAASQEAENWLTGRVVALQSQLQLQETAITDLIATAQIQEDAQLDTLSNQVLEIEQQLQAARTELAALRADASAQNSTRGRFMLAERRAEVTGMVAQRDRLLTQLSAQSSGMVALNQMQRQADATRVLYENFLARLQETRVQRGLETPDSHLVAAATTGTYAGTRKTLIVMISTLVGMLLGLMIVALRHTYRTGVTDAAALQNETGVPVFAQIPRSKAHRAGHRNRQLRASKPVFGNAMQNLRVSLQIAAKGPPAKIILATSSLPNEDSTAYAHGLTQSFAQSGKSVLLLLAASRDHAGMNSILFGGISPQEAILRDEGLGADTLAITGQDARHNALLADGFPALLRDLAQRYDHVIIDGPPVLGSPQAQILAQLADAIIYSVRWSHTPLTAVRNGLRQLEAAGAPATGLILSQVNLKKVAHAEVTTRIDDMLAGAT